MIRETVIGLAFAAGCVLALGAMPAKAQTYPPPFAGPVVDARVDMTAPQASPGDFGDWSAHRNIMESAQYERLLQTDLGFRQARMRQECGPIADPQLRAQCLASFDRYEPVMTGSSPPPGWQYYPGAGQ